MSEDDIDADNIHDSLLSLLEKNPSVTGAFSYTRTHTSWCNPGLDIIGFGSLGLPLSTRDAANLRDALVSGGSNTEKVQYNNEEWPDFFQRVIGDVCNALGANFNSSKPRVELTDLLFNDPQHNISFATACTKSCAQAFASLLIVLPSKFNGGTLRVTHGDRSESYDYSVRSATNLTVLAWHAGALPEFTPLSDGYYLALSYQIVHTTDPPVPTISLQDNVVSRLRQILSHWNTLRSEDKPAPEKLIHLLRNKYSRDGDLGYDRLKDADARTVSLLVNAGKLHGFNVGLAHMRCVVRGLTDSDQCGNPSGRRIDLSRAVGAKDYDIHWQQPFQIRDRPIRYRRLWKYKFRRVCYKDVVVLWPQSAQFSVTHGRNAIPNACQALRSRDNPMRTPEDDQLVEDVLANASAPHANASVPSHRQDILSSICHIALVWNDLALWLRTVRVCDATRSISVIGAEKVQMAVGTFGFEQMRPYLEQLVEGEPSDITALQFLDDIETWCEGQDSFELIETIPPWAAVQRTKRYNILKAPTQSQCAVLTKLVVTRRGGGVVFKHRSSQYPTSVDVYIIAGEGTAVPGSSVHIVYFPLIFYLAEEQKQAPVNLAEFCEYSLLSWLDAVDAKSPLASEDIDSLFRIISIGGNWSLLNTRIMPKLETLELGEATLRVLLSALHTNSEHIGATMKDTLLSFLRKWAGLIPADKCTTVETIETPVTLGLPEACSLVFEPSMNQPTMTAQYVRDRLGPLLATIFAVCSKHSIPMTSPHFAPVVRQIMVHWVGKVLRPIPDLEEAKRLLRSLAERWTCDCTHCNPVRDFLIVGTEREKEHHIPRKRDVKHVTEFLTNTASSIATWEELPSRSYQRLVVTKTEKLAIPQQWKQDREKGVEFLKTIGTDEAALQAVLGGDYESIVAGLRDPIRVMPNVAPVNRPSEQASGERLLTEPGYIPTSRPGIGYRSGAPNFMVWGQYPVHLPYDEPPTKRRRL
ncbi:hypothetical protein C8Q80DRAFT_1115759 [Daedaleopsis nitida]|nr:hypothetical protein C8Q80DRAFT_1115759 [Daedaleopsis nitida]